MKKTNNNGFSLVEIVIVVAILGVLAAITINVYISFIEKSRCRADEVHATNIKNTLSAYIIESNDVMVERLLLAGGDDGTEVDKIIIALQKVVDDQYGPYLENIGDPSLSAEDYNPREHGKKGWLISINKETLGVSVISTTEEEEKLKFIP